MAALTLAALLTAPVAAHAADLDPSPGTAPEAPAAAVDAPTEPDTDAPAEPEPAPQPAPAPEPEPAPAPEPEPEPEPAAEPAPSAEEPDGPDAPAQPAEPTEDAPAPAPAAADEPAPTDTTAPLFVSYSPAKGGVYASDVDLLLNFECSDPESGMESCELRDHNGETRGLGEFITLDPGTYTWTGTAVNAVGWTSVATITFTMTTDDVTPPTITSDWIAPSGDWSRQYYINFAAADDESGVAWVRIKHATGTFESPYDGAGHPLSPGTQTLEAWAMDKAGNESEHLVIVANVDAWAPIMHVAPYGTPAADGVPEITRGAQQVLDYECVDAVSGVASCDAEIASGGLLDTTRLGEHRFTIMSADNAGNVTGRDVHYRVVPAPGDPIEPTDPEPTDPDPTDPDPTDPEPTDPEPTDPVDPAPAEPAPSGPVDGPLEPAEPSTPVVAGESPARPAAAPEHARDGLAVTGSDPAGTAVAAILLLLAGVATLAVRRRAARS